MVGNKNKVQIKIESKYDAKGTKEAKKAVESLGKQADKMAKSSSKGFKTLDTSLKSIGKRSK